MRRGLAVLAVALALPATAAAQDPPLRSVSDLAPVATGESARAELANLRPTACARISVQRPRGRLTRAKAVKAARGWVKLLGGASRYKKLLARKELRKASSAATLAAAAVPKSPAAALVALLAAADRAPKDPLHLTNASVLLTRLGKPYEALELLNAAARLRRPSRPPMGVDFRALLMNNEGFALLALRRYADAERVLKRAIAREPLLAEAKLNLATSHLCRGNYPAAVAAYVQGRRRQSFPNQIETAAAYVPPDRALDLSQGQEWTLPPLRLPQTPEAGVAGHAALDQAKDRANERSRRAFDAGLEATDDFVSRTASNALTFARAYQIIAYSVEWMKLRPDIKAHYDALTATAPRYKEIYTSWWEGEYRPRSEQCSASTTTAEQRVACMRAWCPAAITSAHRRWLDNAQESDRAMRALMATLSKYVTGVAANLRDPAAQRMTIATFEQLVFTAYEVYVLGTAEAWNESLDGTSVKEGCLGPDPGQPSGEDGDAATPAPLACPDALAAIKFNFSIGVIKLAVSCEQVQASVSTPGPVGAFAQVGYTFQSGTTAMFVGAKAGHSMPGIEGGVKAGIYMNFDSRGEPTDTGLRGTAGAGIPVPGDLGPSVGGKVDISLAGVFL
jgi:tetratricopeptide (TPR) repeat protein